MFHYITSLFFVYCFISLALGFGCIVVIPGITVPAFRIFLAVFSS